MLDHLTGAEVKKAHAAADYLLQHSEVLKLDPVVRIKLDTLRSDLTVEQEERRHIAQS